MATTQFCYGTVATQCMHARTILWLIKKVRVELKSKLLNLKLHWGSLWLNIIPPECGNR